MGQSLKKLSPGNHEEQKANEIDRIIEKCYDTHFAGTNKEFTPSNFYHAVCEIIEEMNKKMGSTQFRVPIIKTLEQVFQTHHQQTGGPITKEEFQKSLEDVILKTGFSGVGSVKDMFLYIFGVPVATLFVKQGIVPKAIPNEIFIPIVTSITVFVLAKLNKI